MIEQNVVVTDIETRHARVAEPTHRCETEQIAVEFLRLVQVVDWN